MYSSPCQQLNLELELLADLRSSSSTVNRPVMVGVSRADPSLRYQAFHQSNGSARNDCPGLGQRRFQQTTNGLIAAWMDGGSFEGTARQKTAIKPRSFGHRYDPFKAKKKRSTPRIPSTW